MTTTITIDGTFAYPILAALSSIFANMYMASKVMSARKKYGVDYPSLYAESSNKNAKAFNSVQRGHQNFLEGYPQFLMLLAISSLKNPTYAGICGLNWIISRVVYFNGYASKGPGGRMLGGLFAYLAGLIPMLGMSGALAYSLFKTI